MLADLDRSVANWLSAAVGDAVSVSFEAPSPPEAGHDAAPKPPRLTCFLYRVCEDVSRRPADWSDLRSPEDRVTGRQPPVRSIQVQYLLSAWAGDVIAEHELLGQVLLAAQDEVIDRSLCAGVLADEPLPVLVRAGLPSPEGSPAPHDVWSSLGVPLRASLELVFVAPLRPPVFTDIAPPAEGMALDMGRVGAGGRRGGALGAAPSGDVSADATHSTGGAIADGDAAAAAARSELTKKAWTTFRLREHTAAKPPTS